MSKRIIILILIALSLIFSACQNVAIPHSEPVIAAARIVEVVSPIYDEVMSFSEGFAAVRTGNSWGFIDIYGNEIVPHRYDGVMSFRGGFAAVGINHGADEEWGMPNEKRGVIDTAGNEIVPPQYDEVSSFYEGLAAVRIGAQWGLIDTTGNKVVPTRYDEVSPLSEGLVAVRIGIQWGLIDTASNKIAPPTYDIDGLSPNCYTLA